MSACIVEACEYIHVVEAGLSGTCERGGRHGE